MSDHSGLRLANVERVHLTLRFIGSIKDDQVESVTSAVSHAAQSTTAFSLRLDGVDAFPNRRFPRVLWVGMEGDVDKLKKLKSCIDFYLTEVDFPPDHSVFVPHVTLARVNKNVNKQLPARIWRELKPLEQDGSREVPVFSIDVIESMSGCDGVTHKTIHRAKLG